MVIKGDFRYPNILTCKPKRHFTDYKVILMGCLVNVALPS